MSLDEQALYGNVKPDDVLKLTSPTKGFLCPLSANRFHIDFLSFSISDYDTKTVFFAVDKLNPSKFFHGGSALSVQDSRESLESSLDSDSVGCLGKSEGNLPLAANLSEEKLRTINYDFSVDVLKTNTVSTKLVFSVGKKEVNKFRLIERHYFNNMLVKNYDFQFGYCIPKSVNTWEAIYAIPLLENELVEKMVKQPYQTKSDSFYFVDGELIIHNKAVYRYTSKEISSVKDKRSAKPTLSLPRVEMKCKEKKEQSDTESASEDEEEKATETKSSRDGLSSVRSPKPPAARLHRKNKVKRETKLAF